MADAKQVLDQMFPTKGSDGNPPKDAIKMYEGASEDRNGFKPGKAWDMRGWLRQITWDLLRFRKIDDGKPGKRDAPLGLWDAVLRIAYQTDENNKILKDITDRLDESS